METKWQPGMKAIWHRWGNSQPGFHGAKKSIVEVMAIGKHRLTIKLDDGSIKYVNAENLQVFYEK
jgi:hypothetical protein